MHKHQDRTGKNVSAARPKSLAIERRILFYHLPCPCESVKRHAQLPATLARECPDFRVAYDGSRTRAPGARIGVHKLGLGWWFSRLMTITMTMKMSMKIKM